MPQSTHVADVRHQSCLQLNRQIPLMFWSSQTTKLYHQFKVDTLQMIFEGEVEYPTELS